MITNCELPIGMLLRDNHSLNDYDFVLFHLYKENQAYREYYRNMRILYPNRLMILDNSAYEFFVKGEKLCLGEFMDAINELSPDYYILPDVLRDKDATIKGIQSFKSTYGFEFDGDQDHSPKPLAVAQGNCSEDLVECYNMYRSIGIEYIGIPFHLSFYKEMTVDEDIKNEFHRVYGEETEDILYAMGRVQWAREHETLLRQFEKVHFLGSHCPLEKKFYQDYFSMDTGYPVKLGVQCIDLETEKKKPDIIIDEFLDKPLSIEQQKHITNNVLKFKSY